MTRLLYVVYPSVVKVIRLNYVQLTFQDINELPFGLISCANIFHRQHDIYNTYRVYTQLLCLLMCVRLLNNKP